MLQRINRAVPLAQAYAAVGKHAPGFDTLRVLAASAVVYHHSMALQHDIVRDDWLFRLGQGYTTLGFLAVCVFFCLSGFLVTPGLLKDGDVPSYLSRRFVRIMPLLVIVVVTTVFVIGPIATHLPAHAYFSDYHTWLYLKNVTTSLSLELPGVRNQVGGEEVNGALWTLRFEWLCYLALAALALARLLRVRMVVLLCWLAAEAIAIMGYHGQAAPTGNGVLFCHLFSYFGAGTLLWLYREHVPVSPVLGMAALVALPLSWVLGLGVVIAPALTAYLVASLGLVKWPWSTWLARADTSFGIYLMHGPIMVLILAFWAPPYFALLFLVTMALALPAALLSWHLIEKPALAHKDILAKLARHALDITPLNKGKTAR
ncbi:hypothetical protein B2G71_19215 [Novosphingobium sp. PC22D]|uniref:acyltransferase family protein n=1 Tax=Novosphingobium sp. PC22D TaxID=1962403 RepID=UPI000BFB0C55|nr:acyltransferase [Novosphingobium sp. PC22D]PEQ10951.1 hypothetical protein B2G71_19215 [Novosphingobium sp. PC22D]